MRHVIRLLSLALVLLLGGVWATAWFGRAPGESVSDAFLRRIAALTGTQMPAPSAGGIQLAQGVALGGPFTLVDHTGRTVTERELQDFANLHLAAFKVPRRIVILDEIPKGATGKLQRIGLAAKLGLA